MFKKGLKLYSIFKSKCPHCQEGDFFEGSRFKANVAEKCNVCGEKFSKEPGFYQGSFILLDRKGKIIDPNITRPSDEDLIPLIEANL